MKNKKWLIIGAVVVVLGVIGMFVGDDTEETPQTTPEVSQNNKEDEVVDVSNLELSDAKYTDTIKSVNKYIGEVKVDGDKVTVRFKEDMPILSEKNLVEKMATDGVDIFQKAFENTKANTVELVARTKFTDAAGKEEVKDAVNIVWTRAINDEIDYSNYKNLLYQDYTKLYMIAESFTIHPGIWNELDKKDKDNMSM